jgi:hypothetical protein
MAVTQGLVQRLKLTTGAVLAWAYIGPTSTNTTLLLVMQDPSGDTAETAFRASMAEALSGALASRQEVIATYADTNATITQLQVVVS